MRDDGGAAMMRHLVVALAMLLWCAGRADAANCTISTTSVSFGVYSVFTVAPSDSAGTVTYRCTGNANIMVTITTGQSGTFNPRRLIQGAEQLSYNLYRDAARSVIWGDGSAGTQAHAQVNVPNNTTINVPVYARVPAAQDVTAGSYTDSVSVTINF
jgi:spore coat protein U-like protein